MRLFTTLYQVKLGYMYRASQSLMHGQQLNSGQVQPPQEGGHLLTQEHGTVQHRIHQLPMPACLVYKPSSLLGFSTQKMDF